MVAILTRDRSQLSAKKEAILIAAARLFSQKGYAAISMRVLAAEIGITPAALYHHYSDKEALYSAVLQYTFTDKAVAVGNLLGDDNAPEARLERLIFWLAELFSNDEVFTKLLHRELLDGDEVRIRLLTEELIEAPFREIEMLMQRLAPDRDARLSAISVIALTLGHFELMPIVQNLSGQIKANDDLSTLANHVKSLILCGLTNSPSSKGEG